MGEVVLPMEDRVGIGDAREAPLVSRETSASLLSALPWVHCFERRG